MGQEIEVVDTNPFVVVPLETVDVSSPLPKELCPVPAPPEARRSRPTAKPAASSEQEQDHQGVLDSVGESVDMEETEDVPKKSARRRRVAPRPIPAGTTALGVQDYRHTSFIAAINLERAVNGAGAGASFSGESTIGGEMITLNVKSIPDVPGDGSKMPTAIYVTCFYDSIMNIRSEGVEALL